MCSATRRQKELELQVLTGPVRNWQGAELSTLGDIIHMGSVAVGADHGDRYFVLFPHTLLILSVSQRMSAFIYEVTFDSCNILHPINFTVIFVIILGEIAINRNHCDAIGRHRNDKKCI